MTDLEALEALQGRARALTRPLHITAGVATLAFAALNTWLMVLLQWAVADVAEMKISVFAGVGSAIAVVPLAFNRLIKMLLARRRMEWIDELARTEGVRREVLETSFTVDSW